MNFYSRSKLNIFTTLAVFSVVFFVFGTVVVKAAPPTVVITVSPGTISSGTSATLSWNTTDATSCTGSDDWSGSIALNGSQSTGNLTSDKIYGLTCTGPEGTATAFTFVTVTAALPTPPTVVVTASPGTISSGASSDLTWTSTNATSCTASTDWSGSKALSGTESTGALTSDKTYTITCTGPGGTATAFTFVTVTATPPTPPTVVITASPGTISSGASSDLTWTSTNASTCTASVDWSGTKTVSGTESTGVLTTGVSIVKTYTITCTGPGGTATASTFVNVNPIIVSVPTVTITASPGTVPSGTASTLTWTSTNATTCTASVDWSGTKATSGTESTGALTAGKTYTITCTGPGGSATATTNVAVTSPAPTGTINFCLILADVNNIIATSSGSLPAGVFSIDLASTTGFATTTIQTQTWTTGAFAPNRNFILGGGVFDAHCVTYNNLNFGNYTYSTLGITGTLWRVAKYNDNQSVQPINNVFDFANYASSTISDGQISLSSTNTTQNVVIYEYDDPGLSCPAPQITSSLTATITLGQSFTYTVTASSTTAVAYTVTGLPAGLTFNSTTNTISGTPTSSGTFNIQLFATNTCIGGIDSKILVLNVVPPSSTGANLGVSKTSNRTSANVGDTVIYTITVTNAGPENATNVVLTDTIPSGISFSTSTASIGSYNSSSGTWNIGNLNNGSSVTLSITGTVRTGYQGQTITNTASVTATQSDPNSGNNTSSVNVSVNNPVQTCTVNCGGGGGGGYSPNANLGVSKTSNRTSANVGDTVIYTITVTNAGPDTATAVTAVDNIPAGIYFTHSTTTQGTYNSGTGMWTIGTLVNGASATLTIQGTVRTGYQGQVITNNVNVYASQTDPFPSNNNASVVINATGIIITPTPTSCYYLYDYLRKDFNNNPVEVRKLQIFLRDLEGFTTVQITGIYDDQTIVALDAFQARYAGDILTPWGHTAPTSYTYILTKKKVNEIYCRMAFPVTPLQQIEIDNYRNFLLSLQNSGIQFPSTGIPPVVVPAGSTTPPVIYGEVGIATPVEVTPVLVTENATGSITSRFTANLFYVGNVIASWFDSWCNWLNWILLLIIAIISYFWYREWDQNKKIEKINKEIDLK